MKKGIYLKVDPAVVIIIFIVVSLTSFFVKESKPSKKDGTRVIDVGKLEQQRQKSQ